LDLANAGTQIPPNDISIQSPSSDFNPRDETLGDEGDVRTVFPSEDATIPTPLIVAPQWFTPKVESPPSDSFPMTVATIEDETNVGSTFSSREATIDIPPTIASPLLTPKVETDLEMLETPTLTSFRNINGDIIDLVSYSESDGVSIVDLSDDNEDIIDSANFDGVDVKHPPTHIQRLVLEDVKPARPPSSPKGTYKDLLGDWVTFAHKEASEKDIGMSSQANMPSMDPPEGLMKLPLHPHQKEGLAWLVKQEYSLLMGGILADDQVTLFPTNPVFHFCCNYLFYSCLSFELMTRSLSCVGCGQNSSNACLDYQRTKPFKLSYISCLSSFSTKQLGCRDQ
jgi:hypothetical protein